MNEMTYLKKLETVSTPAAWDILQMCESSESISQIATTFLSPDNLGDVCLYRIKQLSFSEDYPRREAFSNVLMALDSPAFNFIYILSGNALGVTLDVGVIRNKEENEAILGKKLNASNYGETFENIFCGNFGGSILERLRSNDLTHALFDQMEIYKNGGVIVGVPSVDEREGQDAGFQGIDRLINSMVGMEWRVILVCKRVDEKKIKSLIDRVYEIYDELAPFVKQSIQISVGGGTSEGNGISNTSSEAYSYSKNTSKGHSEGRSNGSSSNSRNSGDSFSEGESMGKTRNETTSHSENNSSSKNWNQSMSLERIQKNVQDTLKYIDEELLARLRSGLARGLYKTSIYYMGSTPVAANRLRVSLLSLFQGHKSTYTPLRSQTIDLDGAWRNEVQNYQLCEARIKDGASHADWLLTLASCPYNANSQRMGIGTYMTSDELSLMAGLPQREIPGLPVRESVEFALNFKAPKNRALKLGLLVQQGRILNMPVKISRDILNKHTFIAGVTGSGKTTTCHKLLKEARLPFLVIEPAKTEYRALLRSHQADLKKLHVFTLGNEKIAPLRLNPFELVSGESITSHIDMLKAAFVSAFPMEASMPQLLEEAIYKSYEDKGWDVFSDINIQDDFPQTECAQSARDKHEFPVLAEFLAALEAVVNTKGFDARLRDDYRGSLISRFSNLLKGSKGALLNCRHSSNFEELIDKNVVIEMENLKSSEDKALVMGFLLSRLCAIIQKKHRENPSFRHLTLIEEAHRLLGRPEYGDSGAKRASVETFTDMLAEIRKYGEGLIIVDQIPNKIAPEALKNTNTKIIHRLFAADDKETVGDMMLMDKKQREYLSALETGEAIVFSENMSKPVNVKIEAETDTSDVEVEDQEIRSNFEKQFPEECAEFSMDLKVHFLTRQSLAILQRLQPIIKAMVKGEELSLFLNESEDLRNWREKNRELKEKDPTLHKKLIVRLAQEWAKISKPPFPDAEFVAQATEIIQTLCNGELVSIKNNVAMQPFLRFL